MYYYKKKNFFKFATNIESLSMEDSNTTGQDRLVRANFQLTVHGYLVPKEIANKASTNRIVTPNKIQFVAETFTDINDVLEEENRRNRMT